jgi:coenzyme F420-dependent glucose-6-phosphate dehydrogenase
VPDYGYALSSEEHTPTDLVRHAKAAEDTGFSFALISDHFHPWVDSQGQSAFVWSVIGAIAQATDRLVVGTGVTCPTIRIHPAIVAHAAATCATLMPGRFFLGVGTGENLNEHVLGDKWPAADERLELLEEAIEVIRLLWQGGFQSFRGEFYEVEQARLYTLPDEPPPLLVAASKPLAAELAGRSGDALISVAPDHETIEQFEQAGGSGKPKYGQITVCWAESEDAGRKTIKEVWPNAGLPGDLSQELATPILFEQACELVREEYLTTLPAGPDPEPYLESLREYEQAGYTHIYLHQIGRDQEGFFRFWRDELEPRL